MRHIIICLLFISFTTQAQELPKIKGVGGFIINETHIDSIAPMIGSNLNTIDINDYMQYANDYAFKPILDEKLAPKLVEIIISSKEPKFKIPIIDPKYLLPEYRVVKLNRYEVAGIEVPNIEMLFYHDTLIKFKSDITIEMREALKTKYGEGKTDYDPEEVTCIYKLTGAEEKLESFILTSKWVNGNIEATDFGWIYYDDNCKKKSIQYFEVLDTQKYNAYTSAVEALESENKKRSEKAKKEQYSKF